MISKDIQLAISFLEKEEIIGLPTETVYGLAGNIYSEKAIKKIYAVKQRPYFNPLIVHIKNIEYLSNIAIDIPESAFKLAHAFWPGPLTLLLKKHPQVPQIITSGKDTVAVRIPNHPVALALLNQLNFPLAAPSANPFGSISPTSAQHVEKYFHQEIPLVLDGGICENGVESTIIGFDQDEIILYRYGAIPLEDIESIVGPISIFIKNEKNPEAPGMLLKHYAPNTKTILSNHVMESIMQHSTKKLGLLVFDKKIENEAIFHQIILSKTSDLKEAAANLYKSLYELDQMNLDIIIAERFPEKELGNTINDRLERASS